MGQTRVRPWHASWPCQDDESTLVDKDSDALTLYRWDELSGAEKEKYESIKGTWKVCLRRVISASVPLSIPLLFPPLQSSRLRNQLSQDHANSIRLPARLFSTSQSAFTSANHFDAPEFLKMRFTILIAAIIGFAVAIMDDCTPGTRCCTGTVHFRGQTFCTGRSICNDLGRCN
ncbi:unnamed protein product [Zymoseptoria tritici ST99CH_1A5]|uniref:Uncharacterized protein n=1 Tax=Zymoseptoria tritici ST99CH_1A5 TaxID=1276529 RepID=A0A1Y6LHF3_ZYMTR|nr:unnamed protein product [Zymoseptoria tritici ST99CH_1A5]